MAKRTKVENDVVRGSDYRRLESRAADLEARLKRLGEHLATERKAAHELGHENASLRSQAAEHIRDINKLLREQTDLRNRLWLHAPRYGAWNGDSGDVVDFERKLDALLGKDAAKYLRHFVQVEKHRYS